MPVNGRNAGGRKAAERPRRWCEDMIRSLAMELILELTWPDAITHSQAYRKLTGKVCVSLGGAQPRKLQLAQWYRLIGHELAGQLRRAIAAYQDRYEVGPKHEAQRRQRVLQLDGPLAALSPTAAPLAPVIQIWITGAN